MADFLQFMKFAADPKAQGDAMASMTGFGKEVITLLTEIRDELREHNQREQIKTLNIQPRSISNG